MELCHHKVKCLKTLCRKKDKMKLRGGRGHFWLVQSGKTSWGRCLVDCFLRLKHPSPFSSPRYDLKGSPSGPTSVGSAWCPFVPELSRSASFQIQGSSLCLFWSTSHNFLLLVQSRRQFYEYFHHAARQSMPSIKAVHPDMGPWR